MTGTDDRNDINSEQPRPAVPGSLSAEVDMDPDMTRIMSETQEAAEVIRQSFVSASRAKEQTLSQAQAEADRIRAEAKVVLADARTEADRLIADSKAETEARLEEAEKQAAGHLAEAADRAEELLRDARAEHATLTETVPRLRTAVAEVDAFVDAFKQVTRRFEEVTEDRNVSGDTDTPALASPEGGNGRVPSEGTTDSPPDRAADRKQAAIEALSSLST